MCVGGQCLMFLYCQWCKSLVETYARESISMSLGTRFVLQPENQSLNLPFLRLCVHSAVFHRKYFSLFSLTAAKHCSVQIHNSIEWLVQGQWACYAAHTETVMWDAGVRLVCEGYGPHWWAGNSFDGRVVALMWCTCATRETHNRGTVS